MEIIRMFTDNNKINDNTSNDDVLPERTTQATLEEDISTLDHVNYQIAELKRIKECIEDRIRYTLHDKEEGQKTYNVDTYSVTIKTGYNYRLNKEEYEVVGKRLNANFNPVKEVVKYEIDKKVVRDAEKYASQDELNLMSQFIVKSEAKPSIKITVNS